MSAIPGRIGGMLLLAALGMPTWAGCAPREVTAERRVAGYDGTQVALWVMHAKPAEDEPAPSAAAAAAADTNPSSASQRPPVAVLLHPWLTGKGYMAGIGKTLARAGWDVVLMDLRGHGGTRGKVTWGIQERHDVRLALDSLVAEGLIGEDVYVLGISLGGCVAVQYAAEDSRCRGVLAVAPTNGLDGADAAAAAKRGRCPLIVVAGLLDPLVHVEPVAIHAAWGGPKALELKLDHHGSIQFMKERYFLAQMTRLRKMAREASAVPVK